MFNLFNRPKSTVQPPVVVQVPKEQQLREHLSHLALFRQLTHQQTSTHLMSITEIVLWIQKHNPEHLTILDQCKMFESMYDELFIAGHKTQILQSLTLLLTNLKNEDLVDKILHVNIITRILQEKYEDDEILNYLVSFLKTVSQRITPTNIDCLIQDDRCLLLQRCASFYRFEQNMIRTATLNILLSLMKLNIPSLNKCFASNFFIVFYINLSTYLNLRFEEVDHCLRSLNQNNMEEFFKQIEDLEDLILFFEDISRIHQKSICQTVGNILYHYVMLPTILGSLTIKTKASLSINLSVFLLIRMLKLTENFGMHNEILINMLADRTVVCCREIDEATDTLSQQRKIKEYYLRLQSKIESETIVKIQDIRNTLFTMLKSKDDNLVYLISTLLINIIRSKSYSKQSLQLCGLNLRCDDTLANNTRNTLLPILVSQLGTYFRLNTLKNIIILIIEVSLIYNEFSIQQSEKLVFQNIYFDSLKVIKDILKQPTYYDLVAEFFENDFKYVTQKLLECNSVVGRQAFMIPGDDSYQNTLGFFQRNPTTQQQNIRYSFVIFILLRKLRYMLFKETKLTEEEINLEKEYNNKLVSPANSYKPGQFYEIPNKVFYPCNIVAEKIIIPCYIIEDDLNFIVAVEENKHVKIVLNLKYKHVNPMIDHKKINNITLKIRGYNPTTQSFKPKEDIQLKCSDIYIAQKISAALISKKNLSRQWELSFISKLVNKCEKDALSIDLI